MVKNLMTTIMLQAFSDGFSSNFNANTVAPSCPTGNVDGLRFSSNIEDVRRLLAANPNTVAGEDGIPGKLLKLLCCELAEPFNIIFQMVSRRVNFFGSLKECHCAANF